MLVLRWPSDHKTIIIQTPSLFLLFSFSITVYDTNNIEFLPKVGLFSGLSWGNQSCRTNTNTTTHLERRGVPHSYNTQCFPSIASILNLSSFLFILRFSHCIKIYTTDRPSTIRSVFSIDFFYEYNKTKQTSLWVVVLIYVHPRSHHFFNLFFHSNTHFKDTETDIYRPILMWYLWVQIFNVCMIDMIVYVYIEYMLNLTVVDGFHYLTCGMILPHQQ